MPKLYRTLVLIINKHIIMMYDIVLKIKIIYNTTLTRVDCSTTLIIIYKYRLKIL